MNLKTQPPENQPLAFGRGAGLDMVICVLAGLLGTFWVFDAARIDPTSFHAGLSGLMGFGSAFFFLAAVLAYVLFAFVRIVIRDKIRKEAIAAFSWPPGGLSFFVRLLTLGAAQCCPSGLRRPPRALF